MSTPTDPFQTPTPRTSAFASADSFRGRLVLIRPTKLERDVPKQPGSKETGDRVTANVTVVDGLGPVQIFSRKVPTGRYLEGPEFRGVWFGQEQIAAGLQDLQGNLHPLVLGRLETLKPGASAGQGNPWTFVEPTEEDKNVARAFLANQMVGGAAAPTQPASQAPPAAPAPAAYAPPAPPVAPVAAPQAGPMSGPPF